MRFHMAEAGVFRLMLSLIRHVNQEIESIAILVAIHDCIELLFVKPKQLLNGGGKLSH